MPHSRLSLEAKIQKIKEEIMTLGVELQPGLLTQQYNVCGSAGCRCKVHNCRLVRNRRVVCTMPSKIAARIGPIDGIAQSRGMDVAAGFSLFYAATTQMGGIFI